MKTVIDWYQDSFLPKACLDNLTAIELLESLRWGITPRCPRCGSINVAQMKVRENAIKRNVDYKWKCNNCCGLGKICRFTVANATPISSNQIEPKIWCLLFYLASVCDNGISVADLKKCTNIANKTAYRIFHRIHEVMKDELALPTPIVLPTTKNEVHNKIISLFKRKNGITTLQEIISFLRDECGSIEPGSIILGHVEDMLTDKLIFKMKGRRYTYTLSKDTEYSPKEKTRGYQKVRLKFSHDWQIALQLFLCKPTSDN